MMTNLCIMHHVNDIGNIDKPVYDIILSCNMLWTYGLELQVTVSIFANWEEFWCKKKCVTMTDKKSSYVLHIKLSLSNETI